VKRFRKCDTTKYRRRRKKEKIAHGFRVERRRREEMERHARIRRDNEQFERIRREYKEQEQALVDVLAARLYQLSPEHAEEARRRAAFNRFMEIARLVARF
jgi:Lon protease-like protein